MDIRLPWWSRRWVWVVACVLTVAFAALAIVVGVMGNPVTLAYVAASGVWAPLGLLVWRRRPEHPIGPLVALVGILNLAIVPGFAMGALLEQFPATITPSPWPMVVAAALSGTYSYVFLIPILLFPEGRPVDRSHRALMWLILAATAVVTVTGFLAEPLGGVAHPFVSPGLGSASRQIYDQLAQGFGFALLLVVVLKVVDFRRSETLRRAQLKWLVFVLALYVIGTIVSFGIIGIENFAAAGLVFDALFLALIPAAMAVAVLRYRLYEIDRLVSRTITYALVALTVTAIFVIPVVLLPSSLGESNPTVVAVGTLAAAAVFTPARRWIQSRVDRRFNRSRYDADREVESLERRLRDMANVDAIMVDTVDVVNRLLAPNSVRVWIRGGA